MTQQTEQICFCYDGSEEARKALKWVNEKFKSDFSYVDGHHFTNMGFYIWGEGDLATHRLVTPAEFLRLVKGENEWKVGDECMIDEQHNLKTYKIEHITSDNVCMLNCLTIDKGYTIRHLSTLRHVRKSVREELIEFAKSSLSPEDMADRMLNHYNVTPKH